jgi:hypothetical protein
LLDFPSQAGNPVHLNMGRDHIGCPIGAVVVDDSDSPVGIDVVLPTERAQAPVEVGSAIVGADDDIQTGHEDLSSMQFDTAPALRCLCRP